jgi:hypothetical protein
MNILSAAMRAPMFDDQLYFMLHCFVAKQMKTAMYAFAAV